MTDITERLRELSKARWDRDAWERETTVRIPAEPDRDIDLVLASAAEQIGRLRARVAELEAVKYGSNPSMVLLDEVHANGVDVDAIPISRLIAALDVLHRRVQERDDDGAATPGDLRAALRAIFNKGE